MGHIPPDARWYLADIVLEHVIEDDERNVVHINTVLVRANSPERAYVRALELGRDAEHEYENTDGKRVSTKFRGLRDLTVIFDKLAHGAELIYAERIGVAEADLETMVRPKEDLGLFAKQVKPSRDKPNYMPGVIMDELKKFGFNHEDIYAGEPQE